MQTITHKPQANYRLNEYKFSDSDSPINSTYGTALQSVRPDVVFLKGKAKFTPSEEKPNYGDSIAEVAREFAAEVKNLIKNGGIFQNRYLLTYSFSDTSIRFKKPSLLRYELTLKPIVKDTMPRMEGKLKETANIVNEMLVRVMSAHGFTIKKK